MSRYAFVALLGTLVLVLLAAGCGSASRSPGVANLGTTGTTTDASTGGAPPGSAPSADNGRQAVLIGGGGLKFSQCMRAHGVANFPDPNSQGVTQFGPGAGIDPQSAPFQAASQACRNDLRGKEPRLTLAQQARARRQALGFSVCMRKHGIPDFPDPSFGANGNAGIHLAGNSSDLNPSNPNLQAALQACHGFKLGDKKFPGSLSAGGPK